MGNNEPPLFQYLGKRVPGKPEWSGKFIRIVIDGWEKLGTEYKSGLSIWLKDGKIIKISEN